MVSYIRCPYCGRTAFQWTAQYLGQPTEILACDCGLPDAIPIAVSFSVKSHLAHQRYLDELEQPIEATIAGVSPPERWRAKPLRQTLYGETLG